MNIQHALDRVKGQKIESVSFNRPVDDRPDTLRIELSGVTLSLRNDYQCCEERYMSSDDDLGFFKGAELMNLELRDGPNQDSDGYGEHEVQFLLVTTSKGVFTMASHNIHNGYYSGFRLEAEVE